MPLRTITAEELIRRLRATSDETDKRFAFFLGAGCSCSSKIPAAGELVREHWLPRLCEWNQGNCDNLPAWIATEFPTYDSARAATFYGPVIDRLFLWDEERQREIERLCDGRFPSFGYAVLATLVAREGGVFNTVLTTNFDDLVADALYLFTKARPLVIHHESLAGFIRPTRTRPLIIKLHGDNRLTPQNTVEETMAVKEAIEKQVRALLNDRGVIFIGYGGHDAGIAAMFEALPEDTLPLGVYWVNDARPGDRLMKWLERRKAMWVQKRDFDEVMLLFHHAFALTPPDRQPFDDVFDNYERAYREMSARITALPATAPEAQALKAAAAQTDQSVTDWSQMWTALQKASVLEDQEPSRAESEYRSALQQYPTAAALHNNFAMFLDAQKNRAEADVHYRRAIEIEPRNSLFLTNYAAFLEDGDPPTRASARTYYEQALAVAPSDSWILTNFALYLENLEDPGADQVYQRAITADPNNASLLVNYADLLDRTGRPALAELQYRRAIEIAPSDADAHNDFAVLLERLGKLDEAETEYRQAVSLAPADPVVNANFADFLARRRGDLNGAERHYDVALATAPDDLELRVRRSGIQLARNNDAAALNELMPVLADPAVRDGADPVAAEAWFYAYTFGTTADRARAIPALRRALSAGARIPTRDFAMFVTRARANNHPNPSWLDTLAQVLKDALPLDALAPWPAMTANGQLLNDTAA